MHTGIQWLYTPTRSPRQTRAKSLYKSNHACCAHCCCTSYEDMWWLPPTHNGKATSAMYTSAQLYVANSTWNPMHKLLRVLHPFLLQIDIFVLQIASYTANVQLEAGASLSLTHTQEIVHTLQQQPQKVGPPCWCYPHLSNQWSPPCNMRHACPHIRQLHHQQPRAAASRNMSSSAAALAAAAI